MAKAQRQGPVEPLGEAKKPAVTDGLKPGDYVWMADRSNGRVVEHLATVVLVKPDTLTLLVKDNGTPNRIAYVAPWSSSSVIGWWRTK